MSQQIADFEPYVEEARSSRMGNPKFKVYTPEEDARILEVAEMAEREGIPMGVVWQKLADEFDRTANGVQNRYYSKLSPAAHKQTQTAEDDDDNDPDESDSNMFDRLKAIVKEYNYYKKQYEHMKGDYDRLVAENDKLNKEMNKIRRLLG